MRRIVMSCALLASVWVWALGGHAQEAANPPAGRSLTGTDLKPIPEGKGLLYLFNASGHTLIGGSHGFKIDGHEAVKLSRREYGTLAVDPGPHKLEAVRHKLSIDVTAGHYYFVVYAYHPEKSWAGPLAGESDFFGIVAEDRACELLSDYREKPVRLR